MEVQGTGDRPLKGMIRNRVTDQFYAGNGLWSSDMSRAMHFDNLSQVVEEAQGFETKDDCEFVVEVNGKIGFRVRLPL